MFVSYWTMERGGKVDFESPWFSPKGGMSIGTRLWGCVDKRGFVCVLMRMEDVGVSRRVGDVGA